MYGATDNNGEFEDGWLGRLLVRVIDAVDNPEVVGRGLAEDLKKF